ncbi:SWF or SNF family helicase [Streptomyces sp. NPDC101160]|uniref:SWIM zinc finger family protein n=1 Tax=Streptomyces sp. NPDC101160 TaxID=3366118 RepID=UPI0037F152A7
MSEYGTHGDDGYDGYDGEDQGYGGYGGHGKDGEDRAHGGHGQDGGRRGRGRYREHGDATRTFAALPPVQGGTFARTWWGRAWLQALEDTALDGRQLKAGRRHARAGAVGAVSVRPGRITALVRDPDGTSYRSDVLLQELSEAEWDRLVDLAVASAGHIAALLDREMPPHLVEDAAAAGLELLPGIGDLEPECGCEAWDHCPHTAALCYQVARLLDEDPFVLMLMRGRGERALIEALQERSAAWATVESDKSRGGRSGVSGGFGAAGGAGGAGVSGVSGASGTYGVSGVSAAEAFAAGGILPPLPAPPVPSAAPGAPPSLDTETDPEPGLDPAALEFLAADAAARAHRLLSGAATAVPSPPGPAQAEPGAVTAFADPSLTVAQDAVRLAAGSPASWIAARLAAGTGRTRTGLDLAVRAWRLGGPAGLAVLEEEWTPDPDALRRAEARLLDAWDPADRPALQPSGPARWTLTGTDVQLRLGEDGRWWPYREEDGLWTPAGPPEHDPAAALSGVAEG